MGVEQPFAGRLRVGVESRFHNDGLDVADPLQRYGLEEYRLALTIGYAPLDWLVFSASLPWMLQSQAFEAGTVQQTGLGATELRAKAVVFRDRMLQPRHLVSLNAGVASPLGSPFDAVWEVTTGAAYQHFADGPLSFYASAFATLPVAGVSDLSWSMGTTLMAQAQLHRSVAVRLGADARYRAAQVHEDGIEGAHSGLHDGAHEPVLTPTHATHGDAGLATFASLEALVSPATDWLITAGVKVPVHTALGTGRWEGIFATFGVVVDL